MSGGRILIDAREFIPGRYTGIARVLEGLVAALSEAAPIEAIFLAAYSAEFTPSRLRTRNRIRITEIPKSYIRAENFLSDLSRSTHLFISPYPKLPLFGVHCRAIHIVHDVLDLTHPLYKRRLKALFDRYRLREALRRADITWYDSSWSMAETQKHFGGCGRNPRVRHPGIQDVFRPENQKQDKSVLEAYGLKEGYVLALGNGLPHKNLGVILEIAHKLGRLIVFAGVSDENRQYWESRHSGIHAKWIRHVEEQHLPPLFREAFCLAQPSLIEGYGYPPLEAMACGTPAIISNIPVLVETTGGCAITAAPNNAKEWIEAFRVLESPPLYRDKVKEGLNWVEPLRGAKGWNYHVRDIQELLSEHDPQVVGAFPNSA